MIPDSVPFTVTSGEVAKISARIPFPNLWSDPLALTVDSLTLDLVISPPSKGKSPGFATQSGSHHIDLASSVTSAAGDFVHDELDAFEGAELDRTIRESLILSQDPFVRDELPGAFPPYSDNGGGSPAAVESTTVLASLVERVLARLQCKVKNIRLRVQYDNEGQSGVLELRVGEVRYADETPESVTGPQKTVRALTLSSVGVYLLPLPKLDDSPAVRQYPELARMASGSSYTSSSMSSSEDDDDYRDMIMSQAVADLRVSSMDPPPPAVSSPLPPSRARSTYGSAAGSAMFQSASGSGMYHSAAGSDMFKSARGSGMFKSAMSTASGASMYHSFTDEPQEPEPTSSRSQLPDIEDPFGSPQELPHPLREPSPTVEQPPVSQSDSARAGSQRTSRSATPVAPPEEPEETLLLSFGTEDIVLRMTTSSQPAPRNSREWAKDSSSPIAMPRVVETPSPPIPSIRIDVSVGNIAAALLPSHTAFLLSLAQAALASSGSSPSTPSPPTIDPPTSQPKFDFEARIKGIYVSLVYDLNPPSSDYNDVVDQYFARPSSVYLPIGHVRLKLEDLAAIYAVPTIKIQPRKQSSRRKSSTGPKGATLDITISNISIFEYLASAESDDDGPPGGTFPVLVFDVNLPKQYDVPPGAPSSLLSTHTRSPANLTSFPQFDSVDWRNAGVQKGGGEKAWRVRPRAKGILRGPPVASPTPGTTAISIHQDMDDNQRMSSAS